MRLLWSSSFHFTTRRHGREQRGEETEEGEKRTDRNLGGRIEKLRKGSTGRLHLSRGCQYLGSGCWPKPLGSAPPTEATSSHHRYCGNLLKRNIGKWVKIKKKQRVQQDLDELMAEVLEPTVTEAKRAKAKDADVDGENALFFFWFYPLMSMPSKTASLPFDPTKTRTK